MNKGIKKTFFIVLTSSLIMLSGCSFFTPYKATITQGTVINQEALDTLQPGLIMAQVKDLLGPPFGQDPYDPFHWEYVFYTTDSTFHPDAVRHMYVNFDREGYLTDWKILQREPHPGD